MKIQYAYTTDAGNRECNEDSVTTVENEKGYCFVVADGLGGHDRGEVASQTAMRRQNILLLRMCRMWPEFLNMRRSFYCKGRRASTQLTK